MADSTIHPYMRREIYVLLKLLFLGNATLYL